MAQHLIITQAGFENYTGMLGIHEFVDGRSVLPVEGLHANRIAGAFESRWEDGTNASPAAQLIEAWAGRPATVMHMPVEVEDLTKCEIQGTKWTLEQLEEIADKQGIAGLREVAAEYRLKGKSIPGLINAILIACGGKPALKDPTPEVVTVE